jgi:O-antigen/teichoic acid export membrane protein
VLEKQRLNAVTIEVFALLELMAGTKRFAFNVIMNWTAMAVGMVVPFFLTPVVVRHLGPVAYGVWILAVSTVSYLNLLDLGLRSAIVRFVSKADTEGKIDEAREAINAALWVRVLIAVAVGIFSIGLAYSFPHIFKVPPDLQRAGQITVLLCALGVAITLLAGVFGGVLSAINRFDVLSSITIGQTLARAIGVVLILRRGHGLVTLAKWEFVVVLLSGLATWISALKLFPAAGGRLRRPHMETLKMIWSYSFMTFIIVIAVQVVFYTDNLVVGALLSVGYVAFYSIGGSLAIYSGQVASALGATFIPMASRLDASGRAGDLQRLLLRGTQAVLALSLPVNATLLLRGKTFIGLWMGPQYSEVSGTVLQILVISQFFSVANSTAGQIAFGTAKHRSVAKWAMIEAIANLTLSVILVKTTGVYGVAWGTSISMAVVHLIFWPTYVRKMTGVPVKQYLWEGWTRVTLCVIPFGLASTYLDRHWHAGSLASFFAQVVVTLPIYVATVLIVFRSETASLFRRWQLSRITPTEATS